MRIGQICQRLVLSAAVASCIPGRSFAVQPDMKQFSYIADAVNKINYLKATATSPADHAEEIAKTACEMLTRVGGDEKFKTVIRKGFGGTITPEEKQILLKLGSINDTIASERQALDNLGIDNMTSIQALAAAIPLASTIDTKAVDPKDFLKDIDILQKVSCKAVGEIEKTEVTAKRVKAIAYGVTGVAIGLADAATAYYSLGLAVALSTLSMQIGGKMAADAAHDLYSTL